MLYRVAYAFSKDSDVIVDTVEADNTLDLLSVLNNYFIENYGLEKSKKILGVNIYAKGGGTK